MDKGRIRPKRRSNDEVEKNNLKRSKYKQGDPPSSENSSNNSLEVNEIIDIINNINNNKNIDVNLYKLIDLIVNNENSTNQLEVLRNKLINVNNIIVYKILDIISFMLDSSYVNNNNKDKIVNRELRNKNILRLIEILESINLIKNKEIISVIDSNKLDSCNYSEGLIKIFIREKTKNNYVLKLYNLYRENILGYNTVYNYINNYISNNNNKDTNSNNNSKYVYKTINKISGYYKLCPNKVLYDLLCIFSSSNVNFKSDEVFNLFRCYGKYNVLYTVKLYLKSNYNDYVVCGNNENKNNCNLENVYNLVSLLIENDYVDIRDVYSYLDPEDKLFNELSCHYFKLLTNSTNYSTSSKDNKDSNNNNLNSSNLVVLSKLLYSDLNRLVNNSDESNTGYNRYNSVMNEFYNNNNLKVNSKTVLENVVKKYKCNDYRILLNIENYNNYKNNLFSLENGKLLILSNLLKKCTDFSGENWNRCYSMILHFYKYNYFIYMSNTISFNLNNVMVCILKKSKFYDLFYNKNINIIRNMFNDTNNTNNKDNKENVKVDDNGYDLQNELMVLNRLEFYFLLIGFRCCVDLTLFNNILNYLYVVLLVVKNLEDGSHSDEGLVSSSSTSKDYKKRKADNNTSNKDKEVDVFKNKVKGKVMKLLYKYVLFNVMCCSEGNFQLSDKIWEILKLFTTLQRYSMYQKLMDNLLSREVFRVPFVVKKEDMDNEENNKEQKDGDNKDDNKDKTKEENVKNENNKEESEYEKVKQEQYNNNKIWVDYYESSIPYVKHVYNYYNYKLKNIFKKITYELLKQNKSPLIRSIVSIITSISSVNPMNVCSLIIKQSELFNNLLLPLCELTKYFTKYTIDFFVYLIYSNLVNLINDNKLVNKNNEESGLRDSVINVINVNSVMLCKIYKRHYECDIIPVVVVIVLLVNRFNNNNNNNNTDNINNYYYSSYVTSNANSNNMDSELIIYNVNDVDNKKNIKNRVGVGGYNSLVVMVAGVLEYLLKLYEMINSVYELDLNKVNIKNILFYVPSNNSGNSNNKDNRLDIREKGNSNLLQLLYNTVNNTNNNNMNKLVTNIVNIDGGSDRLNGLLYNPFYETTMLTLLNNVKYDLMYDSQFVNVKMLFSIIDKYNNVIKLTRRQVTGNNNNRDNKDNSNTNNTSNNNNKVLNEEFVEYVNSLSVSDIFTPVEQYNNVISRLYSIIYSVVSLTSLKKLESSKNPNMVNNYVDSLFSVNNTNNNSNTSSNTNNKGGSGGKSGDKDTNIDNTKVSTTSPNTGSNTNNNSVAGKKMRKLYNKIVLLKSNMNNQMEHNKQVVEKFKKMKLVDDENNIGQVITVNFIKYIIYPRVFMGEMESLFCCKLIDLLVDIRLEYFNYFDFVNCFTKMLTPLIKYSTENELNYFILFFNYVFSTIKEWVGNKSIFDNMVDNNPCFCVTFKYQANKQFKYEQLLKIIKKWEYNILLVIFSVYKAQNKQKTNVNTNEKNDNKEIDNNENEVDNKDSDNKDNNNNNNKEEKEEQKLETDNREKEEDKNSKRKRENETSGKDQKEEIEEKRVKGKDNKEDMDNEEKDGDNKDEQDIQETLVEEEKKENLNYIEIKNVIIFLNKIVNNFPITFNSSSKILNFLINILKISKSNKWNDINLSTNTLIKMIQMYQNQNKFITIT